MSPSKKPPSKSRSKKLGESVIAMRAATLSFDGPSGPVHILQQIDLDIYSGQSVAIVGPSGAGKTSLLMVMAGLENLSAGQAFLAGHDITSMDEDALARIRRDHVGIIFQAFRLIPSMTALQNVCVPLALAGISDAQARGKEALGRLGLGHRLHHLTDALSGGEQQRVAIARAIVTHPKILLADEPTGNLDGPTGTNVMDELFTAAKTVQSALVLITHDEQLARRCERLLRIKDGRLIADEVIP